MMEYCTIGGAAKILKVSRPTVYKLIKNGALGRYRMLGRPALKLREVHRVAEERNGNGKRKAV